MNKIIPAKLIFKENTIYSDRFDDIYGSTGGYKDESNHIFIDGNDLKKNFTRNEKIVILETGFGAGINFINTVNVFSRVSNSDCWLNYISIELHPFKKEDLDIIFKKYNLQGKIASDLIANYPPLTSGFHLVKLEKFKVQLLLLFGDIEVMLRELSASVDIFFLDGFSPKKNPKMWDESVIYQIARLANPGATLTTYSVSSSLRTLLIQSGFEVEKKKGFKLKKEMLKARILGDPLDKTFKKRNICIVGAGIAGLSTSINLINRGHDVTILDSINSRKLMGSNNPAAIVQPHLSYKFSDMDEFMISAFYKALRFYKNYEEYWNTCGLIKLFENKKIQTEFLQGLYKFNLPGDLIKIKQKDILNEEEIFYPNSGFLIANKFSNSLLEIIKKKATYLEDFAVASYDKDKNILCDVNRRQIKYDGDIVFACSQSVKNILNIDVSKVYGNILKFKSKTRINNIYSKKSYIIPFFGDFFVGATYREENSNKVNLKLENELLLNIKNDFKDLKHLELRNNIGKWYGFRSSTNNRMPCIGKFYKNSYIFTGLGSRGFTTAPLLADTICSLILNEPLPIKKSVFQRFMENLNTNVIL